MNNLLTKTSKVSNNINYKQWVIFLKIINNNNKRNQSWWCELRVIKNTNEIS